MIKYFREVLSERQKFAEWRGLAHAAVRERCVRALASSSGHAIKRF